MNYALLTACCIITIELFIASGLLPRVRSASRLLHKTVRVIGNRHISEFSRERVLPLYALRLFTASVLILLTFLIVLLPFVAAAWLGDRFDPAFPHWLLSAEAIVVSLVIAVVYLKLRSFLARR